MVLLEFAISPVGKGEELVDYVSRCLNIIDQSGITYQLTPMSTILEGEWDEVMAVVSACYRELEQDCNRISSNIKIDYRAGSESRIKSKVEMVEEKIGRKLST